MSNKLINSVAKAINDLAKFINEKTINRNELTKALNYAKKILSICDLLHKGGTYKDLTPNDLPPDNKYEELKNLYETLNEKFIEKNLLAQMEIDNKIARQYQRKDINKAKELSGYQHKEKSQRNPILIMDGIILPKEIPTINEECIIMPKFDGCTVAMSFNNEKLLIAHTRGIDSLTGDKNINYITEKISLLFNPKEYFDKLYQHEFIDINVKNLNEIGNNNETISVKLLTKNIREIRIRAECVKRDKNSSETATGYVAGAINGKLDTFKAKINNLCLRPFEIGLIKYNEPESNILNDYIPSQKSALEILKLMNLLKFNYLIVNSLDSSFKFINLLDKFQNEYKEPLDGLVYCPSKWTYPYIIEESSKRVNYSKYKFKRNNIAQSKLLGINYSMGATGKYTASLEYEPIIINNKKYHQAKMAFKRIIEFGDIYVGQTIDVELKADINPMVINVYNIPTDDKTKKIKLIKKCIYCGEKLEYNKNKQNDIIVSCVNNNCLGLIRQKICKFLTTIGYKGISEKTLINNGITDISEIEFKKDIKSLILSLNITKLYIACGIITVKAKSNKQIILDETLTMRDWNLIRKDLNNYAREDIFIKQIINFIDLLLK